MAQTEQFGNIRSNQHDRHARRREFCNEPVDLNLGGDIDAACGLVENEKLQPFNQHPFRENNLLLIATAHISHDLVERRRTNIKFADLRRNQGLLSGPINDWPDAVPLHGGKPRVFQNVGVKEQTIFLAFLCHKSEACGDCVLG